MDLDAFTGATGFPQHHHHLRPRLGAQRRAAWCASFLQGVLTSHHSPIVFFGHNGGDLAVGWALVLDWPQVLLQRTWRSPLRRQVSGAWNSAHKY